MTADTVTGEVARVQAPAELINTAPSRESILARASDIPRSCRGCRWLWKTCEHRWVILQINGGCPWHGSGSAPTWAPGRRW